LTFGEEIKYMWPYKLSVADVLFVVSGYTPFAEIMISIRKHFHRDGTC
jgi:hypothetical protein